VVPERALDAVVAAKEATGATCSSLEQLALAELITSGQYGQAQPQSLVEQDHDLGGDATDPRPVRCTVIKRTCSACAFEPARSPLGSLVSFTWKGHAGPDRCNFQIEMSLDDRQPPSTGPVEDELVRRALAIIDEETAAWAQERFERRDHLPGGQPVPGVTVEQGVVQDNAEGRPASP
jgi:hypothetical protein